MMAINGFRDASEVCLFFDVAPHIFRPETAMIQRTSPFAFRLFTSFKSLSQCHPSPLFNSYIPPQTPPSQWTFSASDSSGEDDHSESNPVYEQGSKASAAAMRHLEE